jgi:hypothetical protein
MQPFSFCFETSCGLLKKKGFTWKTMYFATGYAISESMVKTQSNTMEGLAENWEIDLKWAISDYLTSWL